MKTIGIIGAMEVEIAYLKSKLEIVSAKNIIGMDFFVGKMVSKSIVLARCGVGKVNAAICAQVLIDLYGADYIINTGLAGGMGKGVSVGDIVISSDLVHHDFQLPASLGLKSEPVPGKMFFEADQEIIRIAKNAAALVVGENKTHVGRIASGDQFIESAAQKEKIDAAFKPLCVEMEGAAIGHTATLNKIPFGVIRAISDMGDEEALGSLKANLETTALNCAKIVEEMIRQL